MKIFSTLKKQATSFLEQYKQQSPATYAAAQQAIGAILITDGFIGIDNPFGGKKRPGIFGTVISMGVGVLFLFIPTIFGNMSGVNSMTATTQGTVVSVSRSIHEVRNTSSSGRSTTSESCALTARYTVAGKEYSNQSSISSSANCGFAEGQAVTINYNPDNPGSWTNNKETIGLTLKIFFWVGVLMIVSSIITFIIRLLSIIFGWRLLKTGRKLAETLPQGTNLDTIINEIKQHFVGTVFNFGGGAAGVGGVVGAVSSMANPPTQPPAQNPAPPVQPTQPPPVQPTQTPPPIPPNPTNPDVGPSEPNNQSGPGPQINP